MSIIGNSITIGKVLDKYNGEVGKINTFECHKTYATCTTTEPTQIVTNEPVELTFNAVQESTQFRRFDSRSSIVTGGSCTYELKDNNTTIVVTTESDSLYEQTDLYVTAFDECIVTYTGTGCTPERISDVVLQGAPVQITFNALDDYTMMGYSVTIVGSLTYEQIELSETELTLQIIPDVSSTITITAQKK